jgi:spore coat polysaccharide biosynthesis protein SpsF (cytidylyltransferase family)
MVKSGALITARYDSNRFPGKVVARLAGEPVIGHIIRKAKKTGVEMVVVCTTFKDSDDVLEKVAYEYGAKCYRGHPVDLHQRWSGAVRRYGLTHFILISGDCPFVDVRSGKVIVEMMKEEPTLYDSYGIENYPHATVGIQCCGYRAERLEKVRKIIYKEPDADKYLDSPGELENRHAGEFSTKATKVDWFDKTITPMNLCIDYPVQLQWAEQIVEHIGHFPDDYSEVEKAYREMNGVEEIKIDREIRE